MSLQLALFIILVVSTFFNNGVQAYIHFEAYPLLAFVGKAEFAAYLKEYERRLTLPLLIPYGITMLSNLILLFTRPDKISVPWVIVAFVLNLAVSVVTFQLATPVYNRVKQAGEISSGDTGELLRINALRLGLSTLSSLVVIYLLASVLTS
jgi:hypothetical protein